VDAFSSHFTHTPNCSEAARTDRGGTYQVMPCVAGRQDRPRRHISIWIAAALRQAVQDSVCLPVLLSDDTCDSQWCRLEWTWPGIRPLALVMLAMARSCFCLVTSICFGFSCGLLLAAASIVCMGASRWILQWTLSAIIWAHTPNFGEALDDWNVVRAVSHKVIGQLCQHFAL
jgi:hypothetical protein